MEIAHCFILISLGEGSIGRHNINQGQALYLLYMIEGEPVGNARAPIMAD